MESKSFWQIWVGVVVMGAIALSVGLIANRPPTPSALQQETKASSELINATLREFDDQGRLIWEVEAKQGKYRQDQRIADIVSVRGKFYERGEVIIIAEGEAGVLNQATQEIQIRGNVRGRILREKIDIMAEELEWSAQQDRLRAKGKITLKQEQEKLKITAAEMEGSPTQNRYTLKQDVIATAGKIGQQVSNSDQPLVRVTSDVVTWDVQGQKIFSETPITARQEQAQRQLTATKGEWNTKTQQVLLTGAVVARDEKTDVELKTDRLEWDLTSATVTLPNPFVVESPSRTLTITAQTGKAFLEGEKINLQGSVQAELRTEQATVRADRVEWLIPAQTVTASGSIRYTRRANNLVVTGDRALANLAEQSVQVTGTDVITQFNF